MRGLVACNVRMLGAFSVAPGFHEVDHKCTKYNLDDIPALEAVNSEVCEYHE